jgi:CDP-diacylglycerol---glycerol-3-phosphate 3-phosphatidyltransferase
MWKDKITLATWVTIARGILACITMVLIHFRLPSFALATFSVASATDGIDGHLARSMHEVTRLGAFLDTTIDKFLINGTLIFLYISYPTLYANAIASIFIREMGMILLREHAEKKGIPLPVDLSGKWKGGIQYVGIGFMFPCLEFGYIFAANMILCFVAAFTIGTGVGYVKKFIERSRV